VSPIYAVIPAAGYSSRMGRFKPLLPLGDKTVIERVAEAALIGGADGVIAVTGHNAEELSAFLAEAGIPSVFNAGYADGMFSSIQAGIRHIQANLPKNGGLLIFPADYPLVRAETITRLIKRGENSSAKVVYPLFRGRRGHPPLLSADCRERILEYNGDDGLRGLLREFENAADGVETDDFGVVSDLDAPGDYAAALETLKNGSIRFD